MERAESLARLSHPHPNPRVGAVLLDPGGNLIGEGHHIAPGQLHAEIVALQAAGDRARGATLWVTLEPCNHTGLTPPCTSAILAAGVTRVVVGAVDPDLRVGGAGIARLEDAGVAVEMGSGAGEQVDPAYFHHRRTGRPLVTLKMAATLDGQTAAADGTSRWITSEEARADAHRVRIDSDAVVIGAGTLRADDPLLDARVPGYDGPQPRPVIIAGTQPLPTAAKIWQRHPLVVSTTAIDGIEDVVVVDESEGGFPDLGSTMTALAGRGYLAVLVEGGAKLAASLFDAGLVDKGILYLGAVLATGTGRPIFDRPWPSLATARPISIERATQLGPDLRIDFTPH